MVRSIRIYQCDRLFRRQVTMSGLSQWPTTSVGLLAGLREADNGESWERFSTEYAPALLEFCLKRGLQQADADDVVQAVFVVTSRKIGAFEFHSDRGRFRSWLSTIALRAIWKLRQRELACPVQFVDPSTLAVIHSQQRTLVDEINASVLSLASLEVRDDVSAEIWDAFSSVWSDGQRPQDVAQRLGRSPGWVYKAKFNVLERLRVVVRRISSNDISSFQPAGQIGPGG